MDVVDEGIRFPHMAEEHYKEALNAYKLLT